MVNALKQHCSPLAAGKYRKSSKRSTQWCHQTNGGKSGLEAETARALGALRSLRSKKEVAAGKSQEMHFSSDDQTKKRVEDYVEGETAGARQRVEDAEAAVQQEEEDMEKAENAGLMNRQYNHTVRDMMVAIGDSLSDLANSNHGEDGEDEDDEETGHGLLRKDD